VAKLTYARALLKLVGGVVRGVGALRGSTSAVIERLSDELKQVAATGVQLGLVIAAAGNSCGAPRRASRHGSRLGPTTWDAGDRDQRLALQDIPRKKGRRHARDDGIRMEELAEPYIRRRALAAPLERAAW